VRELTAVAVDFRTFYSRNFPSSVAASAPRQSRFRDDRSGLSRVVDKPRRSWNGRAAVGQRWNASWARRNRRSFLHQVHHLTKEQVRHEIHAVSCCPPCPGTLDDRKRLRPIARNNERYQQMLEELRKLAIFADEAGFDVFATTSTTSTPKAMRPRWLRCCCTRTWPPAPSGSNSRRSGWSFHHGDPIRAPRNSPCSIT